MKAGVAAAQPSIPSELRAMTAAEVAALLGLSPKTVYEHAAQGRIPGLISTGARKVRFSRPVIEAWLRGEGVAAGKVRR